MGALLALAWATITGLLTSAIDLHLLSFPHHPTPIVALVSAAIWLSAVVGGVVMFWDAV